MSRRAASSSAVTTIPPASGTDSIEMGLREFLLKSGAGSMLASSEGPKSETKQSRSYSAESSALPPITKDIMNHCHASTADGQSTDTARLMETLASEVGKQHVGAVRNRGSQKLVSGSQFRMPQKEPVACVHCDGFDKQLKKSKETNRVLRLQISRLEEKLHDLKKIKPDSDGTPATVVMDSDYGQEEYGALSRRCSGLENEVATLKKRLIDMDQEKVKVDCLLILTATEKNDLKDELEKCKDSIKTSQQDRLSLERDLSAVRIALAAEKDSGCRMIAQSANDLTVVQTNCQNLQNELSKMKGLLEAKDSQISTLESSLQAAGLGARALEGERDRLRDRLNQIAVDSAKAQSECAAASHQAMDLQESLREAENLVQSLQQCVDTTKIELDSASSEVKRLRLDNRNSELKQMELIRRMTADSESTQKALEKAITASVRLCVVAPTVNVHIPDKKMNLKSSVSDTTLREFLSKEVLEKYTFLFKQRQENASPEEGLSIQAWVEQMLRNMQAAIEQHVYKAIEGSV